MAHESLSQNEIDALLGGKGGASAGGDAGSRSSATAAAPAEPFPAPIVDTQLYDFRRPHRVSTEKLRSLEALYERAAKSLESWLLSRLRGNLQLQLQSVEQLSFGEFTQSLPTPCASYTFEIHNTGGQHGVTDFGADFAYYIVDRLFGGGEGAAAPERGLTPLERMAVRSVADKVLVFLAEAWQDYLEMQLLLNGFESIPEIIRIANREDPVLVATFEFSTEQIKAPLLICLPFAVLDKFFSGGNEARVSVLGSPDEQETNRQLTEHSLRGTRVAVSARLPDFRISLRELLALQAGHVIATGIPRTGDIDVVVGKQRRFTGLPGRVANSLAIRITDGLFQAPETIKIPFTRQ